MIDQTRKLTPDQAAKHIGVSAAQLAKLRMTGEGPTFLKLGRKVMYQLGDIETWLAGKRLTQSPPKGWKGGRKPVGSDRQTVAA
ncbi:helix-turn-helix domain-containing protein [Methylobacterium organophilum]|jgi:hypothetical protein|uniref:helix-turn-helix transcriptional regulator n=1 Tax=Methylobacterium organophilum TaxID=410 RepID=UPI0019D2C881|nr:helix-turn-helix domain-containing protein [Methylobacterium organophilum]MBN6823989.1 helix-turn-helix domain-containing protein [Methylobacterium organophilum]